MRSPVRPPPTHLPALARWMTTLAQATGRVPTAQLQEAIRVGGPTDAQAPPPARPPRAPEPDQAPPPPLAASVPNPSGQGAEPHAWQRPEDRVFASRRPAPEPPAPQPSSGPAADASALDATDPIAEAKRAAVLHALATRDRQW